MLDAGEQSESDDAKSDESESDMDDDMDDDESAGTVDSGYGG